MSSDFDPYRVLGLPVGASRRDIQKRYRKLLRTHHPDVSDDPQRAHVLAAEIGRAYRVLMDDARRARYEDDLFRGVEPELQVVVESADPGRSPLPELLSRARRLLERGEFQEAQFVLSEALSHEPDSAEAYEILAKTYEGLGLTDLSREMQREAERLAGLGAAPFRQSARPQPAAARERKPTSEARPIWTPEPVKVRWGLEVGAVVAAAVLLWLARPGGAESVGIVGVSGRAALLGAWAAFLLGAALSASGRLMTFDQELGDTVGGSGMPLWALVLAASGVWGLLGAAAHLLTQVLAGVSPRSLAIFWAAILATAALTYLLAGADRRFLWLGVNILSLAGLVGWALGSIFSPREWWRQEHWDT